MRAVIVILLLTVTSWAFAALPPEEYDRLRQVAPVVIGGVVLQDPGGQAQLRVEHVGRGPFSPGMVVTVVYPVQTQGPAPIGGSIYYQPFSPGSRLMVYGQGAQPIYIVDGGIDVLSAPPPQPWQTQPRQDSGCASCVIGRSQSSGWPLFVLALLAWRRRRTIRPSCASAACS